MNSSAAIVQETDGRSVVFASICLDRVHTFSPKTRNEVSARGANKQPNVEISEAEEVKRIMEKQPRREDLTNF